MRQALRRKRVGFLRAGTPIFCALAVLFLPPPVNAASGAPPRPKGAPGQVVTPLEAKALADWSLAQPQVAARFKGHRTRLLRAGLTEEKGDRTRAQAVLWFRDYDAGIAQAVIVSLDTGSVALGEVAALVQPSPEEIREGMTIVLQDPALASFAADPTLTLLGGFHNRSPYADDPCSREVCVEFAFMRPGPNWGQTFSAVKLPPRRVIVNLSRGAVVNRNYRRDPEPGAPPARMTAGESPR